MRLAIRTDLDVSMLVEAAAGTGKTSSLVSRMVALIRNGRCTIDTLAAITFTVKAAAQLRERFQEAVENEIAGTAFGVERECLQAARDNLARSFIGTTHAFCARLLHERPMEAALDPEFEELDEVRAKLLAHDFWTAHVERLVSDSDPRLQELRDAELPVRFLREGFIRLVQYPDVTMVSEKGPRPDLTAAAGALVGLVAEIAPDLPPEDGHEPDELEKVIRKLVQKIRTMDERDPADQFDLLDDANHASRKAVQKRWPDKKKAKDHTDAYKSFVVSTVRPILEQWRVYVHGVALGLLEPAVKLFERNGSARGR